MTWSLNAILCNSTLNLLCRLSGPSYYLQEAPAQQEHPSMGAEQLFPIDGGKEEAYTAEQLAEINLPTNLSPSNSMKDLSIQRVFIINTFVHERARFLNTSIQSLLTLGMLWPNYMIIKTKYPHTGKERGLHTERQKHNNKTKPVDTKLEEN